MCIRSRYSLSQVDLKESLHPVIDHSRNKLATKNISLHVRLGDQPLVIHADPMRMHQLFFNLFENAFRYTDANGHVLLSAELLENHIKIEISDSTPCVPQEDMEHIFQRFYRVERSRNRASGGTGLGLSICRNIVKAHNASITAKHSAAGGLTITILFPRNISHALT